MTGNGRKCKVYEPLPYTQVVFDVYNDQSMHDFHYPNTMIGEHFMLSGGMTIFAKDEKA